MLSAEGRHEQAPRLGTGRRLREVQQPVNQLLSLKGPHAGLPARQLLAPGLHSGDRGKPIILSGPLMALMASPFPSDPLHDPVIVIA